MPLTIETWFDKLTSYLLEERIIFAKEWPRTSIILPLTSARNHLEADALDLRNQKEMIHIQEHFSYILAG